MMADPISVSSGIVTLVMFTFQSSVALYQTIQSFKSSKRSIRELEEELGALTAVLQSLNDVAGGPNVDFSSLELPLRRCGKACRDFEKLIGKITQHSSGSRTSFRDWANLTYMGGDITVFKNMIAGYKSIIMIALGDANLRTSIVTADVLKDYKRMIDDTTSDLQEHLESINEKLEALQHQALKSSTQDNPERQMMEEEKYSTQKCLEICAEVTLHISKVQPGVFQDISTPSRGNQGPISSLNGLILARSTTSDTLELCKGTLTITTSKLESHLQDIENRLQALYSASSNLSDEQQTERDRIQEELNSTKQGLAICAEASEKAVEERVNILEDVSLAENGHQVIVSTIGDLILAKRVTAGRGSTQWMGQMSDASLQHLTTTLSQSALEVVSDTQYGVDSKFEGRYGTGIKLDESKPNISRSISK